MFPCEIPSAIRKSIESFSDEGFWTEENLTRCLQINPNFGTVLSFGFGELLDGCAREDTFEYHGLESFLTAMCDHAPETSYKIVDYKAWLVLELRRLAKNCWKMTDKDLSIQEVLTAAYISETRFVRNPMVRSAPVIPKVILDLERLAKKNSPAEDARLIEQGTEILKQVFVSRP